MTIKKCACGCAATTKNVKILGRKDWGEKTMLFMNCQSCKSTLVIGAKKKEKNEP